MNYVEQFKKDNDLKDEEHFFMKDTFDNYCEVYFKGNTLKLVGNPCDQEFLLVRLLKGETKPVKSYILTQFEYDLLKFWKSKGYCDLKRKGNKIYLLKESTECWYKVAPDGLYKDLFAFSNNFNFDDVLQNYSIEF